MDIANTSKFKIACNVASFFRCWIILQQLRWLIKAECEEEKHRQKAKFHTYSTCDKEIRQQKQGQETGELILEVQQETKLWGTQI